MNKITELQTIADQIKLIIDTQIVPTLAAKRDALGKAEATSRRRINQVNQALIRFERCDLWIGEFMQAIALYGGDLIAFDNENVLTAIDADPMALADALIAVLTAYAVRVRPPIVLTTDEARMYLAMPIDTFKMHVHRLHNIEPLPATGSGRTHVLMFSLDELNRFREARAAKAQPTI